MMKRVMQFIIVVMAAITNSGACEEVEIVPRRIIVALEHTEETRWQMLSIRSFVVDLIDQLPLGSEISILQFGSQVNELAHTASLTAEHRQQMRERVPKVGSRDSHTNLDLLIEALKKRASKPCYTVLVTQGASNPSEGHSFVDLVTLLPKTFPSEKGHALPRYGHADVAYDLIRSRRFPSWLYHFEVGLTEIPETWDYRIPDRDGPVGLYGRANVFNMFASTSHWLFSHIGGIRPDEENPGFKNVIIHPEIGGGITCADVTYDSVRGPIRSHWWIEAPFAGENRLYVETIVPPNTTADVHIPAKDLMSIWVAGNGGADTRAVVSDGITDFYESDEEEGVFVFHVGSGNYKFYSVSDELFPQTCPTGTCPCGSD